jgi:hypothetical protein
MALLKIKNSQHKEKTAECKRELLIPKQRAFTAQRNLSSYKVPCSCLPVPLDPRQTQCMAFTGLASSILFSIGIVFEESYWSIKLPVPPLDPFQDQAAQSKLRQRPIGPPI